MAGKVILLAVALALGGCLGAATSTEVVPDASLGAPLSPAAVPTYLHDLSEPIDGLTPLTALLEHFRIPAADGVALDTWIVRPDTDEPVPLVLEVTPYYGGGPPVLAQAGQHFLGMAGDTLVARGYAYGISSVRGTGNSAGCFTQGGPSEAQDTAAVIEALAAEPWSNGKVGLMGVSYPGTTPQDVWVEAPPALATIVPVSGISDLYKYNFVNGIPLDVQGFGFNTYYWAAVGASPAGLGMGTQLLDPTSAPAAIAGEACQDQLAVQEGGVSSTLDGNKDDYWQARDFLAEYLANPEKTRASVLYIHGLQDWNVKPHNMEDWLPAIESSGVPYKVMLGQWGHAWPYREDWWESIMVAWFDQFLKGVDTGILDAPAVQVEDDDGEWRHESVWPPTDVEWQALHPGADGSLSAANATGSIAYHDEGGWTDCFELNVCSTVPHEIVYFRSEVLAEDLHLAGMPRYEGTVTASEPRASLIFTLAEEMPDGTLRPINYAGQSLNHVESLAAGKADISGLSQWVSLRFFPQDDVVHKGSRIVLAAAGNTLDDRPEMQPLPTKNGLITLTLDDATFYLPVDRSLTFEDPQPKVSAG